MKFEKINEKQLRCTLTREDLENRQMKLSELAYGTEKAKSFFQDMMQQARSECGFEPDNSPLMIEAVPMGNDSLMLIITKVDDPEELDGRFSRFTDGGEMPAKKKAPHFSGADEVLELFHKIAEAKKRIEQARAEEQKKNAEQTDREKPADAQEAAIPPHVIQSFRFRDLDRVIKAARGIGTLMDGSNALYKREDHYQLILHSEGMTPENFNKVCNILSEYGESVPCSQAHEAGLKEHGNTLIGERALQQLCTL